MPNRTLLTPSQWKRVKNDYIHSGMPIRELATKYAITMGSIKARCFREKWKPLRDQFAGAMHQLAPPTKEQDDSVEVAAQQALTKRHAEEDQTDLVRLLPQKRDQFLRETIKTAEILLGQIKTRARVVGYQNDNQLKTLVTALSDLIGVIKGPLALEATKPEPMKPMAVQVNILHQVLEQADRIAAGKHGHGMRLADVADEKKAEL